MTIHENQIISTAVNVFSMETNWHSNEIPRDRRTPLELEDQWNSLNENQTTTNPNQKIMHGRCPCHLQHLIQIRHKRFLLGGVSNFILQFILANFFKMYPLWHLLGWRKTSSTTQLQYRHVGATELRGWWLRALDFVRSARAHPRPRLLQELPAPPDSILRNLVGNAMRK